MPTRWRNSLVLCGSPASIPGLDEVCPKVAPDALTEDVAKEGEDEVARRDTAQKERVLSALYLHDEQRNKKGLAGLGRACLRLLLVW